MILSITDNPSGRATISFTGWLLITQCDPIACTKRRTAPASQNSISASTHTNTSASVRAKSCTKRFHVRDLPPSGRSTTSTPARGTCATVSSEQPFASTRIRVENVGSAKISCASSRATIAAIPCASLWAKMPISTCIRSPSVSACRPAPPRATPPDLQPSASAASARPRPAARRPSAK